MPVADQPTLLTADGAELRLLLDEDSAPLAYLDGHLAELWGKRVLRKLTVEGWVVMEGLHGLPTWVGEVVVGPGGVHLADTTTDEAYRVDDSGADVLREFAGLPVLVEGYIEDAQVVRVVYFRVLAEEPPPATSEGGLSP